MESNPIFDAVVHTVSSGCLMLIIACTPDTQSQASRVQYEAPPEPAIAWDPQHYVAYFSEAPIAVDGRLVDASWMSAEWTSEFVDIEGPALEAPRFSTRAKMLWDSTYFYIAAKLEEPHVWGTLSDRDAVVYYDNDFEIFIDPDGDTHEYYELELNALGTEWDLFLVKPYRDGGLALNAWDIKGLRTAVSVDGTLNDPSDVDSGWSVEIAIPWDVLAEAAHRDAPPAHGDQWRVNFSRVEWRADIVNGRYEKIEEPAESRTRPEDNWVWSPQGLIAMHYPEMWGFVQFSSTTVGNGTEEFLPRLEDEAGWLLRQIYYKQHEWLQERGVFTDDAAALGYPDPPYDLKISATHAGFDAWLVVKGQEMHISRDGRIW